MRDPSRHILFIATEYTAGMRPYANAIIHALWQPGDHVVIVTRDDSLKHDFVDLPADAIEWVDYPTRTFKKIIFRWRPTRLLDVIQQTVVEHGLQLIYCLTGELILAYHIKRLQRLSPVLYTIHDAIGHDSKFDGLTTWLKHKVWIAWPQRRLIKNTTLQVTNSKTQQQLVQEWFPYHKVHYAPFPTLVTEGIVNGTARVDELAEVNDGYILFFGNLQLYKGVHLLYEAYLSHPELQTRPLVIAGSGYIYFKRVENEQGITFVNRFIDDTQLGDLFSRAAVVVYPYISATQSGVTSIASYYGKPMVLSDLPFFKQVGDGVGGIEFFASGDSQALAAAIVRSLQSGDGTSTRPLYDRLYTPAALNTALSRIIDTSCADKKRY